MELSEAPPIPPKDEDQQEEQPGEQPTITFTFKDRESIVFQYSRQNVNIFQLAVISRVLQTVVEMEMAAWHASVVQQGQAGRILVPTIRPTTKYRGH